MKKRTQKIAIGLSVIAALGMVFFGFDVQAERLKLQADARAKGSTQTGRDTFVGGGFRGQRAAPAPAPAPAAGGMGGGDMGDDFGGDDFGDSAEW